MTSLLLLALGAPLQPDEAAAHLTQVARAVELYAEYEGRLPNDAEELTLRPVDAPCWPEGGFLAGGAIPPDIHYQRTRYAAVLDAGEWPISILPIETPPRPPPETPHAFEARVRVELIAAAARAYRGTHHALPNRLDDLRHPIAPGLFESPPWGALSFRLDGATLLIRLDLNPQPPPPEQGWPQAARALLPGLRSEDPAERDRATHELAALGPGALGAIEQILPDVEDPEVRARLVLVAEQLRSTHGSDELRIDAFVVRGDVPRTESDVRIRFALLAIAHAEDMAANMLLRGNYWIRDVFGLHALRRHEDWDLGAPARYLDEEIARADVRPLRGDPRYGVTPPEIPQPYRGYFFRAAYAELLPDEIHAGYAICAYPAEYGLTGRWTYIIDEDGSVYARDLGGAVLTAWPSTHEKETEWRALPW